MSTEIATTQNKATNGFDFRWQMMSMPVDKMIEVQDAYSKQRDTFRGWLQGQMIEGVHFGFAPGCEPKFNDKGEVGVWNSAKKTMMWYSQEQWRPKPSLYKAGAHFICDLLNLVSVYETDRQAWEMLGSVQGMIVTRCRLYPRGTTQNAENLLGEGVGVGVIGQKGADANNAAKMSQKRAMVDAVLNCYGLSDLFTQDTEDSDSQSGQEAVVNPAPRQEPRVQPRAKRDVDPAIAEAYEKLKDRWKSAFVAVNRTNPTPDQWAKFVVDCDPSIELANAQKLLFWTEDTVVAVLKKVQRIESEG